MGMLAIRLPEVYKGTPEFGGIIDDCLHILHR